jgi:adenylate kinase family enzyme
VAWFRKRGVLADVDGLGEIDEVAQRIDEALKRAA